MLSKLKGQNGQTNGELHGIHLTANYAKEAAHLAHLIFEKNSLRYQLEGTTLIQNRRKFLANDLHILLHFCILLHDVSDSHGGPLEEGVRQALHEDREQGK